MRTYKGYKFRLYPTREQEEQLRKLFAAVHFTYNRLLIRWSSQPGIDLKGALEELIHENPWLSFINRSILLHTVVNLERACRDNVRQYGPFTPGCGHMPRFKNVRDSKESFTISSGNDIYIRYNKLTLGGQRGLNPIRVVQSRSLPRGARVCSATVSHNRSGEYSVSLLCSIYVETDPDAWKQALGLANGLRIVGLDYSLPGFFVASDSYLRPDAQFLNNARRNRDKLAAGQRRLSRMQKGSANYEKQRVKVARIHRDIVNQRMDYLHKLSTQIADHYDIVCVETLDLVEMEQFSKGFARRVQDNGWAEFVQLLDYKLRDRGRKLVKVGKRFPSSKRCHECSYINRDLQLSDREWTCPVCGAHHNRDINASLNIRDEGLRILLQQEKQNRTAGNGMSYRRGSGDSPYYYEESRRYSDRDDVSPGMRSRVRYTSGNLLPGMGSGTDYVSEGFLPGTGPGMSYVSEGLLPGMESGMDYVSEGFLPGMESGMSYVFEGFLPGTGPGIGDMSEDRLSSAGPGIRYMSENSLPGRKPEMRFMEDFLSETDPG